MCITYLWLLIGALLLIIVRLDNYMIIVIIIIIIIMYLYKLELKKCKYKNHVCMRVRQHETDLVDLLKLKL